MSWLGSEALPGDLAGINRARQAWLDAADRHRLYVKEFRQRGLAAAAIHWMMRRTPLFR
jgi:hypothetical protein